MSAESSPELPPLHERQPSWFTSDSDSRAPAWVDRQPISARHPDVTPDRVVALLDTEGFGRRHDLLNFSGKLHWLGLELSSSERGHVNPSDSVVRDFERIYPGIDAMLATQLEADGWTPQEQAAAMGVVSGKVILPRPEQS